MLGWGWFFLPYVPVTALDIKDSTHFCTVDADADACAATAVSHGYTLLSGKHYKYLDSEQLWKDAVRLCGEEEGGGRLATFKTEQDWEAVKNIIPGRANASF